MQTSSLQNTTILYAQLSLMATSVTTRKISNSVDSELSSLISAIKSGNTAEAQGSLAEMQMMGQTNVNPDSALGAFLSSVSASLSSFNIRGAQKAVGVFEASAAPRVAAVEPASALMLAPSAASGPGVGAFGQDLLSLFSAIHSGDATSAQFAYGTLSNLMESNGGSGGNFGNMFGSNAESGSLYSLMAQIGAALNTGNLTRVQSTMDQFMQNLSSGSLVSATA
ncbi:MAG: hypothetical protein WAN35_05595 [Terracidiphilus sp.]